jgi:hypothetical protein
MSVRASKSLARRPTAKPAGRPAFALLTDVRGMILQARAGVARAVDSGLATLYWHVGQRIRQDVLKGFGKGDWAVVRFPDPFLFVVRKG